MLGLVAILRLVWSMNCSMNVLAGRVAATIKT
jgi:hypothetical protein